jgi:hypothetical protein
LNSSVNWRRARRFAVSAIGLDIVFPFGKMSTKPDQVHIPADKACAVSSVSTVLLSVSDRNCLIGKEVQRLWTQWTRVPGRLLEGTNE